MREQSTMMMNSIASTRGMLRTRRILLRTLAVVATFVLVAWPAAGVARAETIRVAGRVEDEKGEPVGGVEVRTRLDALAARTAADGRFVLQADAPPKSRIGFLHASTADGAAQAFTFVGEERGQPAGKDVRLTLKRAREFPVSVADADGRPVGGALVRGVVDYSALTEATTDAAGKALLRVPADAPMQYVMVFKPGAGMDYVAFWAKDAPAKTDPFRLAHDHAGPLAFVLRGAKRVTVRVLNGQGLPLKGVDVNPWYFEMPRKGEHLNMRFDDLRRTTDARGVAELEFPANNTTKVTIWARHDGYFAPERCVWDPASAPAELTTVLVRKVRVTGRVLDETGRPAGGATVRVAGSGLQFDNFREELETAPDGSFAVEVNPDMYYAFVATR